MALKNAWMYRAVAGFVWFVAKLLRWKITFTGLDHVPPGGYVLAHNHIGHTDAMFVALGPYRRDGVGPRFLVQAASFDHPLMGPACKSAGHIPVYRAKGEQGGGGALDTAVAELQSGASILIAPEGQISPSFEVLPLKTGAVRLAQQAGVPLVPSAIWGIQRSTTYGLGHERMGSIVAPGLPVDVRYGPPITVGRDDDVRAKTDELRQAISRLVHQLQDEYRDTPKPGKDWWQPARLGGSAPTGEQAERLVREAKERYQRETKPGD